MKNDFREIPIVREILPHTGRLDGDDTGYRNVAVSPLDVESPDPMVDVEGTGILVKPIYATGAVPGLCPYYGEGLGAKGTILVRTPVRVGLTRVEELLRSYNRRLVILDGWRSVTVQAKLWRDIFLRISGGDPVLMSHQDIVRWGIEADKVGSFAPVQKTNRFEEMAGGLLYRESSSVDQMAASLGITRMQYVEYYATFCANLGLSLAASIKFDTTANTAHGGGGAVDVYTMDTETGKYACLGVPFDFVGTPAVMDYFENDSNFDDYWHTVSERKDLCQYLLECRVTGGTREEFRRIRDERRILFHAMRSVGATFFSLGAEEGEAWHFNLGNEGGRQYSRYPGAGNSCHSLLRNVADESGQLVAVWGNATGHRLAAEILGSI